MKLQKKLIQENFLEHLKKHSGKYLAGAGGMAAGVGVMNMLNPDEESHETEDPTSKQPSVSQQHMNISNNTDISTNKMLLGVGALGAGALVYNKPQVAKDIGNAAKSTGSVIGNAAKSTGSVIGSGIQSTKDWVEKEKRLENPAPKGVDTGMSHGPRQENPLFKKSSVNVSRDLNKPTQAAFDANAAPLTMSETRRRVPLTGPKKVNMKRRENINRLKTIVSNNPN